MSATFPSGTDLADALFDGDDPQNQGNKRLRPSASGSRGDDDLMTEIVGRQFPAKIFSDIKAVVKRTIL